MRSRLDRRSLSILAPAERHALGLGTAQRGNQVFAQLAFGHGVDAHVVAHVRHGALECIGPHELECARSLRGRLALGQEVLDLAKGQGAVLGRCTCH